MRVRGFFAITVVTIFIAFWRDIRLAVVIDVGLCCFLAACLCAVVSVEVLEVSDVSFVSLTQAASCVMNCHDACT